MEGEINSKRQRCEVWSRVTGYLRPVSGYNPGKQSEYYSRKKYAVDKDCTTV